MTRLPRFLTHWLDCRHATRLISQLGLDASHVAVERNGEIVPRASFDETTLMPADKLEIVTFVGGG